MRSDISVTMRPLRQEDAAFLCSIFQDNAEYYEIFYDSESDPVSWSDRVKRFLAQNIVHHFIMEANGEPVGWLSFSDTEEAQRELCILVVAKEKLRCGYGTKALLWLMKKSKAERMQGLLLNVNQSNTRAIGFYQKFGFEIYAEEIVPECNEAVNLAQYKMRLSFS